MILPFPTPAATVAIPPRDASPKRPADVARPAPTPRDGQRSWAAVERYLTPEWML